MCKNYHLRQGLGFGFKRTMSILLVAVLALSSAFAWPWDAKESNGVTRSESSQIVQLQSEKKALQYQMSLLEKSLSELQSALEESEKELKNLQDNSPEFQKVVEQSKMESQALLMQIEELKNNLELSEIAFQDLEVNHENLMSEYQVKVAEADDYFKQLSESQARVKTLEGTKQTKKWAHMFGASVLFQNFKWGIEGTYGVGFKNMYLTVGAQYMFGDPIAFNLGALKSIRAKAGIAIVL